MLTLRCVHNREQHHSVVMLHVLYTLYELNKAPSLESVAVHFLDSFTVHWLLLTVNTFITPGTAAYHL